MKLEKWIDSINIAENLDEQRLALIAQKVCEGYETDESSREEWMSQTEEGMKIARQVLEEKSYPWPGAANVKYPLILSSAIQFNARAYPEIVQGNDIVKGKVVGYDPEKLKQQIADRISKHMSWQLLEEMPEWEPDLDKLLIILPTIGNVFRKTFYCPIRRRNVSELVMPDKLVVNQSASSIDDARRVTHLVELYNNQVIERRRADIFLDIDYPRPDGTDDQAPHEFFEQHIWLDLDGDDYEEPYIVTVHRDSRKVARIVARYDKNTVFINNKEEIQRIDAIQNFTHYGFIPDPAGGFYYLGFCQLLYPLNAAINTVINQLLDAGSMSNLQCGLIGKGLHVKGGVVTFQPGEYKQVETTMGNIKDNFFPLPVKEPSAVLFTLLGFLTDTGKQLASVSEVMQGEQPGANVPASTVLALIEQGMKVFSAIYKRVYRSLKSEYKKLFVLNSKHLDEQYYYMVLDAPAQAYRADYDLKSMDVVPVADPSMATDIQRIAKAQALLQISGRPGLNEIEITRNYLQAIKVPNADQILPPDAQMPQQPEDPRPQIEMLKMQMQRDLEQLRIDIEERKVLSEIDVNKSVEILNIAKAEAAELGPQLDYYKAQADQLHAENMAMKEMMTKGDKPDGDNAGAMGGMAIQPDNGGSVQSAIPTEAGVSTGTDLEGISGGDISAGGDQGGLSDGPGRTVENELGGVEARAEGGPVDAGQPYLVGENGPEVIVPQQDGFVLPNNNEEMPMRTYSPEEEYYINSRDPNELIDRQLFPNKFKPTTEA